MSEWQATWMKRKTANGLAQVYSDGLGKWTARAHRWHVDEPLLARTFPTMAEAMEACDATLAALRSDFRAATCGAANVDADGREVAL